jgi:thermostable 8-oxoguanine DNA glycosylase
MHPFKDKSHISQLLQRADNAEETKRLTSYFSQLQKERHPFYLTLDDLQQILKWKLRRQFHRQETTREVNTNENVIAITKAAFGVAHPDKDFETSLKLRLLCTLTGVEVPVASAILTLCFPTEYSVIDFRNWRQIYKGDKPKTTYSIKEYVAYLKTIRHLAMEFGVTPQEIDIAFWQSDIEQRRKKY